MRCGYTGLVVAWFNNHDFISCTMFVVICSCCNLFTLAQLFVTKPYLLGLIIMFLYHTPCLLSYTIFEFIYSCISIYAYITFHI